MTEKAESQLASTVLMIRPVRFESNPLTAASNRFQGSTQASSEEQQDAALDEFDSLVEQLRDHGVAVIVVADTAEPHTPDSIFPNNWISFHADGRVVLYPMEAENRRTERRMDVVEKLDAELRYTVREIVDLSHHEQAGHYLEGTGSMVLDRVNRIAYACLSSRTQLDALGDFAQRMDYDVVTFEAVDRDGAPIYHTNVLMNVGEKLAVICDEAISRDQQRSAILQRLEDTGHEIISLSYDQLEAFAGNMLELRTQDGGRLIAMSQQAFDSLSDEQVSMLQRNGKVLSVAIDQIEASAGGSVRCMLAEVHLPRN
ncbi:MAG: arginine deiminase-related protein [Gammaproteobacteria bacterium]|nr:arginine deiminase-related protein [Gammaproteobacteria bacterium]MDH3751712.1 arginine deiminase-related protein [Gammaproteobacteria bacterium]MDH3805000.1 arginine deiminase-related protein [Gammaproteobacteria bacterium]